MSIRVKDLTWCPDNWQVHGVGIYSDFNYLFSSNPIKMSWAETYLFSVSRVKKIKMPNTISNSACEFLSLSILKPKKKLADDDSIRLANRQKRCPLRRRLKKNHEISDICSKFR